MKLVNRCTQHEVTEHLSLSKSSIPHSVPEAAHARRASGTRLRANGVPRSGQSHRRAHDQLAGRIWRSRTLRLPNHRTGGLVADKRPSRVPTKKRSRTKMETEPITTSNIVPRRLQARFAEEISQRALNPAGRLANLSKHHRLDVFPDTSQQIRRSTVKQSAMAQIPCHRLDL